MPEKPEYRSTLSGIGIRHEYRDGKDVCVPEDLFREILKSLQRIEQQLHDLKLEVHSA